MISITNIIKQKYYTYQPGDFLPIYVDGKLANTKDFHKYRLKWIIKHHRAALHQFTHYAS